jgi:hypothetical protein
MAVKELDDELNASLSEGQRLALLEKSVSLNRIVSLLVAVALIIAISVGLTILIFSGLNKGPVSDHGQQITRLELEISTLKNQMQTNQLKMEQMETTFALQSAVLKNSSTATLQKVLVQQEMSYQKFLNALKGGMYDLANMVPGSRTWLEHYNEELNLAIQLSINRQRELQQLQSGGVPTDP